MNNQKPMNPKFFSTPDRFYHNGQTGNRGYCSHDSFTETLTVLDKQQRLARVCDNCGNRNTFTMYAKYSNKYKR